ncbi:MAG: ubiquinone/menaquinone biosynthesis methyltransferase [Thermoleophilia bacterium]|jgi:demethylmenaquinone methyltransferase/2-methoxy-6-polyprenyl-1,4-benzoquinol methylase|nr:ubiquinone/menaquinone biosynthesis methyltransferase [Thermoleophilia bacterium]
MPVRVPEDALARDPQRIEGMFSAIVPRYDLMNRLMTAGLDRRWRRLAAAEAGLRPGDEALDACCGTGDLALTLLHGCPDCRVIGADTSEAMLARARQKAAAGCAEVARGAAAAGPGEAVGRADFVRADLLDLPFVADRFAAATVAFGVRNVPDPGAAFAELCRVVRPGGRVVCLEMTTAPPGPGRLFHSLWSERIVPLLGRFVGDDAGAYSYLPASVATFPDADGLAAVMAGAGLTAVRYRRLGFGAVSLHVGVVP